MLIVSLSLNQTLLILFLFGGFNWFRQFLCERLSSFNSKGFYYSYTWSCGICEGKTSFCTRLISRKLCRFRFLLVFSAGFTSLSALLLFPELIMFFMSLCMVFDSVLFNIEVLFINPSANVFQITLLRWLTFLLGSLDYDSQIHALLNFFLLSQARICSVMACPPLGSSDHVAVSVSIDSLSY